MCRSTVQPWVGRRRGWSHGVMPTAGFSVAWGGRSRARERVATNRGGGQTEHGECTGVPCSHFIGWAASIQGGRKQCPGNAVVVSAKETVQAHRSSGQVLPKSPGSRSLCDWPLSSIFAPALAPIGLGRTYTPHPCRLSLLPCCLYLPPIVSPCLPPSLLARRHLSLPPTISPCHPPSLLSRRRL